ncbi:MAG: tRNA epoxyqueuosine(34) reductase QueG [Bacteroidales bacterium]|nr:tRNA epoxyqueuosine(34) reductase QueG [Bacteroidales bacterium]
MSPDELHINIHDFATRLGFAGYGAVAVEKMTAERVRLESFVSKSYHGSMKYLAANMDIREDPSLLLDGAKSIMVLLVPYKPPLKQQEHFPKISSYAYGLDYHFFVKSRLRTLAEKVKEFYPQMNYRVFTDSAPIFEKALAVKAGLGFIGKNTFLISKTQGLQTLIGIIITDIPLKYSIEKVSNGCGKCTRCIEACPNGALIAPFEMDARRCISYNTIESPLGESLSSSPLIREDNIFGCEICMDICPWSSKGEPTNWEEFLPIVSQQGRSTIEIGAREWLEMEEEEFRPRFSKSPLSRAGLSKIKESVTFTKLKY